MGIFIDLFIILILFICIVLGYKRGLVKVVLGLVAFIIAIAITIIFYKPLSSFIMNNTKIDDTIQSTIYDHIKDENIETSENEIINLANKYIIQDAKNATLEIISESLTETIIEVSSFIFLFIILRIGLIFANKLFSIITSLPIINQFNKLGGLIYGIFQGILINYIIFALILIIVPLINIDSKKIDNTINSSVLGSVLYNENIIVKAIK